MFVLDLMQNKQIFVSNIDHECVFEFILFVVLFINFWKFLSMYLKQVGFCNKLQKLSKILFLSFQKYQKDSSAALAEITKFLECTSVAVTM